MSLWRHKKRGTVYRIITHGAFLQCASAPEFEEMFNDEAWTVYQNIHTNAFNVRPTEEFNDGRFEEIPDPHDEGPG